MAPSTEQGSFVLRDSAAGFCAGIVGTVLGYPLDVVKTRLQAAPELYGGSMTRAIHQIWHEEGAAAFLRGSGPPRVSSACATSKGRELFQRSRAYGRTPATTARSCAAAPDLFSARACA